jgi:hypothetical protein
MWSSGRPMTRHRLQCRVMLPALKQSRKRAPPSITFGKDAPHPSPDNGHSAALARCGGTDSRLPAVRYAGVTRPTQGASECQEFPRPSHATPAGLFPKSSAPR